MMMMVKRMMMMRMIRRIMIRRRRRKMNCKPTASVPDKTKPNKALEQDSM